MSELDTPSEVSTRASALITRASSILFRPSSNLAKPHNDNPIHVLITRGGSNIPDDDLRSAAAALHCAVFYKVGYDSGRWTQEQIEKAINESLKEQGNNSDLDKACEVLELELGEAKKDLDSLEKFQSASFDKATTAESTDVLTTYRRCLQAIQDDEKTQVANDLRSLESLEMKGAANLSDKAHDLIESMVDMFHKVSQVPISLDEEGLDILFERLGFLALLRVTLEISAPTYAGVWDVVQKA